MWNQTDVKVLVGDLLNHHKPLIRRFEGRVLEWNGFWNLVGIVEETEKSHRKGRLHEIIQPVTKELYEPTLKRE